MKRDALAPKLSALLMLVLFCGTFFYHTALGLGYIPPFLGGYATLVGGAVSVPLTLILISEILETRRIRLIDAVFISFIAMFGAIVGYHFLIGEHLDNVRDHSLQIINITACYLIFRRIRISNQDFKWTIILATLLMSATIIGLSSGGRFYIKESATNPDIVANYQVFAIAYMCPLIVSIAKIHKLKYRALMFAVGFVCLYINSSRSEFVQFALFYVAFEMCRSKYRSISPMATAALGAMAIAALLTFNADSANNRIANLLNLSEDKSSNVRDELTASGLEKTFDSPVLGDYGNYDKGYYIHNILSAWQDLGIFGFLIFCGMLFMPLLSLSISVFGNGDRTRQTAAAFAFLSSTIVVLVFGKFFTYQLVGAAIGLYAAVRREQTEAKPTKFNEDGAR